MKINFLWPGLIFGLAFVQGVTGFPGGLLLVFLASLSLPERIHRAFGGMREGPASGFSTASESEACGPTG